MNTGVARLRLIAPSRLRFPGDRRGSSVECSGPRKHPRNHASPKIGTRPRLGRALLRRFLARHPEPGGGTLKSAIDGRLDHPDPIESVAHLPRALPCFDPDAAHLRLDLAEATIPNATAWTVAQILRAIHGAGHAGRGQHALAAHTAVEQETLDQPLGHRRRSLQSLIADRFENGYESNYGALEHSVYALEEARMANGEETNGVHCEAEFRIQDACRIG
jgi:hypothetical protein